MNLKPTNPKDAIGITKVPLHLVSGVVKAYQAVAHYLGNVKYGAWNYRPGGVRVSVYVSALNRHIDRWFEGEKYDPVDGTPHLANAQACINILIEGEYRGNLTDDRPAPGTDLAPLYAEMEAIMVKIREKYKDAAPHHHTRDNVPADAWVGPTGAKRIAGVEIDIKYDSSGKFPPPDTMIHSGMTRAQFARWKKKNKARAKARKSFIGYAEQLALNVKRRKR